MKIFVWRISNIFDNAMAPLKLVSSFLQGDLDKTGRVIGRTIINTTIGLGGMFDVADRAFDIKDVNEDLDQALWGHMEFLPGLMLCYLFLVLQMCVIFLAVLGACF